MNYRKTLPDYDPSKSQTEKGPSDDTINDNIDTLRFVTLIYGGTMLGLSLIFLILMKRYENVKGITAAEVERQNLLKRRTGSYHQMDQSSDP